MYALHLRAGADSRLIPVAEGTTEPLEDYGGDAETDVVTQTVFADVHFTQGGHSQLFQLVEQDCFDHGDSVLAPLREEEDAWLQDLMHA